MLGKALEMIDLKLISLTADVGVVSLVTRVNRRDEFWIILQIRANIRSSNITNIVLQYS